MAHKRKYRLLCLVSVLTVTLTFSMIAFADEDDQASDSYEYDQEYEYNEESDYNNEYDSEEYTDDENSSSDENESTDEEVSIDEENFDPDEAARLREDLQHQQSDLSEQLSLTEKEIEEKQEQAKKLQKQITELSSAINSSNEKISALNTSITQKQHEIEQKRAEIEDVLSLLRVRLRNIHTSGDISSLEIILGAKSFEELIDKTEMIKSMAEYDDHLIHSIDAQAKQIASEQRELQAQKTEIETEKAALEHNKSAINSLFEENTKLIRELKAAKNDLEDEQKENEEKQNELEKSLEAYQMLMEEKENSQIIVTPPSDGKYVWPCPGFTYLTSTFDEWRGENNHGALDIAEAGIYGAKVVACADGVVFSTNEVCDHDYGKDSSCGCGGGYGKYVMIDHGNGKLSIYGHLSGVTVTPGQTVSGGQLIGYVGSTGYSTGAHLHFETRYNGVRYDPLSEY